MHVTLTKNGLTKQVKSGFSWTTLFFGGLNMIFARGEILLGLVVLVGTCLTGGLVQIVYAFFANRVSARRLMEKGWTPMNTDSPQINAAVLRWQS